MAGFERFRKPTRRDAFLAEMQTLVHWAELDALIESHYPKPGNGRPPIGLERMLWIDLLQHWSPVRTCMTGTRCPACYTARRSVSDGDRGYQGCLESIKAAAPADGSA